MSQNKFTEIDNETESISFFPANSYCFFASNGILASSEDQILEDVPFFRHQKNHTMQLSLIESKIWATAWQNQQNDVRPVKTRISLGICPVWSVFTVSSKGS